MNFLVSGVAGDIGLGVGRILCEWFPQSKIFGVDLHDRHPGGLLFSGCAIAPRADSDDYICWIKSYIENHDIDYFIPTSENEIFHISKSDLFSKMPEKILILNPFILSKTLDKYECLRFLAEQGVNVPPNGIVGDSEPKLFPVIIKPRSGQGSKSVMKVDSLVQFSEISLPGMVWQEYLLPDDQEFTCPVFRSNGVSRVIIIRRTLNGGYTDYGEVIENEDIRQYVAGIAEKMDLFGPMNVQLRLTKKGPLLFEINPRLSSTLVFRDKLGFSDLYWWCLSMQGRPVPEYEPPPAGTKFYRGVQEYIAFAGD